MDDAETNDIAPPPVSPLGTSESLADGNGVLYGILAVFGLVVGGFAVAAWMSPQQAPDYQATAQPAGPPGLTGSYTKAQLDSWAFGKTKDQIKAQFGSPDKVYDDTDEWTYFNLSVYDATAGTKAGWVSIRFEGLSGGGDSVASVSFG